MLGEGHADALRAMVERMVQLVMEVEVGKLAGAALHEQTDERKAHRNGYRDRAWDTRVGTLDLRIPRLRNGTYLPSFLEPRRRSEQALLSVIQEAYVHGVSTRK
ncbi:MAG: transposase, partial [Candidatus Sericytochromatia bacterium]|nr:transposase [Candidatus Sericytochromatia bacterium]